MDYLGFYCKVNLSHSSLSLSCIFFLLKVLVLLKHQSNISLMKALS